MSRVAVLSAIFGAALGVQTGFAADLFTDTPEPEYLPPVLWAGFYAGAHIGGAWGDVEVGDTYDYGGDPYKESSFEASGLITGIQLGYNVQDGALVYGIEADLGYLNLSGDETVYLPPPDFARNPELAQLDGTYSMSGGLYGDITARLGYSTDNVLLYLKGGFAFLNADFSAKYVGSNCTTAYRSGRRCDDYNPSTFDFSKSETLPGWTLGVGVEYAIARNWSLKAEYQHFDFASTSFDHNGEVFFSPENPGYSSTLEGNVKVDPSIDVVKVGVNYKFDGGDPLK